MAAATLAFAMPVGGSDDVSTADARLLLVLERAGPIPVLADSLAVDTVGERRLVTPGKCREAGERELVALARGAMLEEAFAFLPSLCTWIDIGVGESAASVKVERGVIDALAAAFGSVDVYHIHTAAGDPGLVYFPAYTDLLGVVLINARHLEDPGITIRHRVATPNGLLEYSFHPSGPARAMLRAIFATGLGPFAGENLSLVYSRPVRRAEYHAAVRRCTTRSLGAADPFGACLPMQAGDFRLDRPAVGDSAAADLDRRPQTAAGHSPTGG